MTTVKEKITDRKTRIQKAQQIHLKNTKERSDIIANTKAAYLAEKDGLVLTDLLEKTKKMSEYHLKIAKDGIGYKPDAKDYYILSSDERLRELDKSSGIDEIVDYINRQITIKQQVQPVQVEAQE